VTAARAASRIIVALDAEPRRVRELLDELRSVHTFKIGMEAYYSGGSALVAEVRRRGHDVFLDLKLHDIPNTVAKGVGALAALGVKFLTVHASGGAAMLEAAAQAASRAGGSVEILAVTVLTSLDGSELPGVWDDRTMGVSLAAAAIACGCRGVVASPLEARALRGRFGAKPVLACPGVRPAGAAAGDQARTATPAEAIRSGADYIVVGRPIVEAERPAEAFAAMVAELAGC
jgi:orotidine-5'-phosphate decarboxylase